MFTPFDDEPAIDVRTTDERADYDDTLTERARVILTGVPSRP